MNLSGVQYITYAVAFIAIGARKHIRTRCWVINLYKAFTYLLCLQT